jgi:hypothetical protein
MEKDLAQELKKDKYYEDVVLPRKTKEKNNSILSNTLIEERNYEDENGKANVEYGVYIKFNGEDVLIANINEKGKLEPNMELLNDDKYSDEDKKKLGDMLNLLGLEKDNVDIEKLQEQLKEIEPKTKEEIEQEREKQKEKDSIKDEEQEQTDEEKDDDEKDLGDAEQEKEQEVLAKKKGIKVSNLCKIRRDSQFYKNYPNIPKTAYFYLDSKDRIHAEYLDKDGQAQELPGFEEIKDRTEVTRLGNDGQNVRDEVPYRVMTAKGLEDKNHNTQDIRIAMYKDQYGYLKIETIHQGRNGEWEGKNIDIHGTDRNTERMNNLIDEKNKTPQTGALAKRQEELKTSGYSQDGLSLDEFSKQRKINEYMEDGYTFEESNKIYDYVVGELQLTEEDAKLKVNEESEHTKQEESKGRDMGEEAYDRLINRGH